MILIQAVSNHCLFKITFTGIIRHYQNSGKRVTVIPMEMDQKYYQKQINKRRIINGNVEKQD